MKILFCFFTLPHLSTSTMYGDMVNIFKEKGHEVFPMAPALDGENTHLSTENGTEVLRVKTWDVFSKNKIKKGLANVLLSTQYWSALNTFWKDLKPDLIIVATPSVMFAEFISKIKSKSGATVYLMQKDIFPQNAVDLGFMARGGMMYLFFKKNETALLKTADLIGCTSPGNQKYLLEHNDFLTKEKVQILYNSTKLLDVPNNPEILKKYGLNGKFNIIFGGNMGKPQQLENVLLLAKNVSEHPDIQFVIIGQGTEVDNLKKQAEEMDLSNFKFLNKVDRSEYFTLLSKCDIGLISLHQNFTVPNTPMKLNDYLNAGIPVLASIDRATDLGKILEENNMGKYAFADEPQYLKYALLELYNDENLRKNMGENGQAFCKKYLSDVSSYESIMNQLKSFKSWHV